MSQNFKEAPAVTVRPASTALFTISSQDRNKTIAQSRIQPSVSIGTPNYSPYSFAISKAESLLNGFFTRLAVTEITMNWTVPNINYYTNTIFVKYQVGVNPPIVGTFNFLYPGFHPPNELAGLLELYIQGLDATLASATVTYGGINNPVFTVTTNSSTTVAFLPEQVGSPIYDTIGNPIGQITENQKQLFDIFGFKDNNTVLSNIHISSATFCEYTNWVDIVCSQLSYNQNLKDQMTQPVARDTICRVYLNQNAGSLTGNIIEPSNNAFAPVGTLPFQIYHNYTLPKQINWTPNQPVGQLQFDLYDDRGNPLINTVPSALAGEWAMSLLVTEN